MNNIEVNLSVALFSISKETSLNYRKLSNQKLCVLLVKKGEKYYLPSYQINDTTSLEKIPDKALKLDTGLENIFSEQLYTFSHTESNFLKLNPTYLGLVSKEEIDGKLKNDCSWFNIDLREEENKFHLTLTNQDEIINLLIRKQLKKNTNDRYWFFNEKETLLNSNDSITIVSALERLKNKINYTDIVFNIMPKIFSLKELQQVYELIQNKKLLDPAFRRIIANKVEETGTYLQGVGCRPSKLFKYKRSNQNE